MQYRLLPWSAAQSLASPLRKTVFIVEQGVPAELEWDEWDELSTHCVCVAREEAGHAAVEQALGTGRLLPDDVHGTAHIGRMAVLREWRGHGIGSGIFAALIQEAVRRATCRIELHAQVHAAGFYLRHGFAEQGDVFDEAGIPHIAMVRELRPRD